MLSVLVLGIYLRARVREQVQLIQKNNYSLEQLFVQKRQQKLDFFSKKLLVFVRQKRQGRRRLYSGRQIFRNRKLHDQELAKIKGLDHDFFSLMGLYGHFSTNLWSCGMFILFGLSKLAKNMKKMARNKSIYFIVLGSVLEF